MRWLEVFLCVLHLRRSKGETSFGARVQVRVCQALAKRCDGIRNSIVIVRVHDNGIEELLVQSSEHLALHTTGTFQQSGSSVSAKLTKLPEGG